MKYQIITGMSKSYFENIGQHMIESWLRYWPSNFNLKIYSEDNLNISNKRLEIISLDKFGIEYHNFQNSNIIKLNARSKTFAKKAWPIMSHLEKNTGRLIWLDADVITQDTITEEWLDSLLQPNDFSCHLGVPQDQYYSVETGFFIINLENKFKDEFLKKYKEIYYNRDFSNMKKPFDGDVFGRIVTEMRLDKNFVFNDLSPSLDSFSPFNKVFKNKMKHYKAKKKLSFISDDHAV